MNGCVDINSKRKDGKAPLHLAALHGRRQTSFFFFFFSTQIHRDVFAQVPAKAISLVAVWPDLRFNAFGSCHRRVFAGWPRFFGWGGVESGRSLD